MQVLMIPAVFTATVAGGVGIYQWVKHRKAVEQELISESSDILHKRLSVQLYDYFEYLIDKKMNEKKFDNEYGTKLFQDARLYMVSNQDNIPAEVMAEIRAAGGLQDYLEVYINRRIAEYYMKIDQECRVRASWLAALGDENIIVNIENLRLGWKFDELSRDSRLNLPLHKVYQDKDDFDKFIQAYASKLGGDMQSFIDIVAFVEEEKMMGTLNEQMLDLMHNGMKTAPELPSLEETEPELESHPIVEVLDTDLIMMPGLENLVEPTELFTSPAFNMAPLIQMQQLNA